MYSCTYTLFSMHERRNMFLNKKRHLHIIKQIFKQELIYCEKKKIIREKKHSNENNNFRRRNPCLTKIVFSMRIEVSNER